MISKHQASDNGKEISEKVSNRKLPTSTAKIIEDTKLRMSVEALCEKQHHADFYDRC